MKITISGRLPKELETVLSEQAQKDLVMYKNLSQARQYKIEKLSSRISELKKLNKKLTEQLQFFEKTKTYISNLVHDEEDDYSID
jgi:hypothetical protein